MAANNLVGALNNNVLSAGITFNVSDLRLLFQVQRWMERNARAGVRYTGFYSLILLFLRVMNGYSVLNILEVVGVLSLFLRYYRLPRLALLLRAIWPVMVSALIVVLW